MAAGDVALSENQLIESLLADAEKRLSAQAASQDVAVTGSKPASLVKIPKVLATTKSSSKKEEELSVRSVAPIQPKNKTEDAGSDWFNMPKTNATPELVRDLKLLRMRNVLNPKQFFKKDTRTQLVPTYCQSGTIIEGPTEFYNARINRKERKKTLAEEVLASSDAMAKFKTKYSDIQTRKMSGRKGSYKKMMAQRYKKR
ncbi:rRNA-processing protein FCF2 [Pyricularia oryzae 70-15]|uniref:rRNA-processing protein FCF2 n=1 Tax=Pyricularia oryzae (strain 70-15 / ATCC MYA-4617 / FGSC 8958) TaxID=242507 RepID=G4NC04_PYRO7|nr:rRNA-processing protein FCF2 [Pyricularia oryzae 70-15]EHA49007.1 rRNA-processing protein FCF2 [Pyricularia oryzae 70-15]KAI7926555.1 rRNA-processing protein FCF2 [Pyricularia oryzae]KAI7929391.1 rRNA-processing protein FCF2 [Pyricularia oryzae]